MLHVGSWRLIYQAFITPLAESNPKVGWNNGNQRSESNQSATTEADSCSCLFFAKLTVEM
jgi:hypothetical protein